MTEEQRKAELIRKIQLIEKIKAAESTSKALDTAGAEAGKITSGAMAVLSPVSTLLEKTGVPEGYSLSDVLSGMYSDTGNEWTKFKRGGPMDPTSRDVAGLVGDTVLTGGVSLLGKAGKLASPAGRALKAAALPVEELSAYFGPKIYKSAFKNVDKNLKDLKKAPISDEMFKSGFVGNMQEARDFAEQLRLQSGKNIESTLKEASERGATADMSKSVDEAKALVAEMRKSPHPDVQASADKMEAIIASYGGRGRIPVDEANRIKSEVNELAGKRAFNPMAEGLPLQDKVERAIGSGTGDEIMSGLSDGQYADLKKRLEDYNKTYGSTKEARKPFKREANKEVTKNKVTAVDLMLAGGTAFSPSSLAVLGAKKVGEAAGSTKGRTRIGMALSDIGLGALPGIPDSIARRSLWEILREQQGEN